MCILFNHVLVLNKAWQPINTCSVKKALEDMNSSRNPKKALKIEYLKNEKGEYDYNSPTECIPLNWNEWITLSPRDKEECIRTVSLEIRIPTVIIVSTYDRMPVRTFRLTRHNIYNHYKGIDYWTGKKISFNEMTIDHRISKDEWVKKGYSGDFNNWKNLVPTSSKINNLKGNLSPDEFSRKYGYKPHYELSEPTPITANSLIKILNPDWSLFVK